MTSTSPAPSTEAPVLDPGAGGTQRTSRRSGFVDPEKPDEPKSELRVKVGRAVQVFLGLFCVGFAVVVLATPQRSLTGLLLLIAEAVALVGLQTILAGGRRLFEQRLESRGPRFWWNLMSSWGILAVGAVAIILAAFAVLDLSLAETAAVFALAGALMLQGFARIFQTEGLSLPAWLRGSHIGTGVLTVVLVVVSVAFEGPALATFAILAGVVLLVTGVETMVAGLHPTDPRQFVILKLVLFSAFYGLVLINWIDLFGKTVPAYGVWLILTYMAPFAVLLVFEGWRSWPLAVSLGLLVSLMNDVGYYFVGNLLFGFHQDLGPWISGQLGFLGSQVVTIFEGGSFTLDVTSWMMGLSIYARAAVVGLILYYWWQHPGEIVARSAMTTPGSPS